MLYEVITVIRLEPGNPQTEEFLAGGSFRWAPDAYVLTKGSNMAYIAELAETGAGGMLPEIEHEAAVDWHGMRNNFV